MRQTSHSTIAAASAVITTVSPSMVITVMISSAGALRDSRIRLATEISRFEIAAPDAARTAMLISAASPAKATAANTTIITERGFSGATARAKRCQERPCFRRAHCETRARRWFR